MDAKCPITLWHVVAYRLSRCHVKEEEKGKKAQNNEKITASKSMQKKTKKYCLINNRKMKKCRQYCLIVLCWYLYQVQRASCNRWHYSQCFDLKQMNKNTSKWRNKASQKNFRKTRNTCSGVLLVILKCVKVFPWKNTFVNVVLMFHTFRNHCLLLISLLHGTSVYAMLCS